MARAAPFSAACSCTHAHTCIHACTSHLVLSRSCRVFLPVVLAVLTVLTVLTSHCSQCAHPPDLTLSAVLAHLGKDARKEQERDEDDKVQELQQHNVDDDERKRSQRDAVQQQQACTSLVRCAPASSLHGSLKKGEKEEKGRRKGTGGEREKGRKGEREKRGKGGKEEKGRAA